MPPPIGQIAYEAYCQSRNWHSVTGELLPPWHDQSPELKTAWDAAAQAVQANLFPEQAAHPPREDDYDYRVPLATFVTYQHKALDKFARYRQVCHPPNQLMETEEWENLLEDYCIRQHEYDVDHWPLDPEASLSQKGATTTPSPPRG